MGYATLSDFRYYGAPPSALATLDHATIQAALDARSAYADSKFRARYSLPLLPNFNNDTTYDPMIVMAVVHLAVYDLIVRKGGNPERSDYGDIKDRAEQALRWLNDVERQAAHPLVRESPASNLVQPQLAAPLVMSDPLQGWQSPFGRGSGIL